MRDYLSRHYPFAEKDIQWYRNKSIKSAIQAASRCERDGGKRHPHQTRLNSAAFLRFGNAIRELDVRAASNFDELYAMIENLRIRGIGPVTNYDTAHRISIRLDMDSDERMLPDKVYLHAHVTNGARNIGIDVKGKKYLTMEKIPAELRRLRPDQIEDVLCIYEDELREVAAR